MLMLRKIGLLTVVALHCLAIHAAPLKKIQIRLQLSTDSNNSKIELGQFEIFSKGLRYPSITLYQTGLSKTSNWELPAERIVGIYIKFNERHYFTYLEPGSDITLHINKDRIDASGSGSEIFNAVTNEIMPQFDTLTTPSGPAVQLRDMAEFNAWNTYLDRKSEIIHRIIDKHASASPDREVWDVLKTLYLTQNEYRRTDKFLQLSLRRAIFKQSQADIDKIYHSIIFNKDLQWLLSQDRESPNIDSYVRFIQSVSEKLYPLADSRNRYLDDPLEKTKVHLRIIDSLTTGKLKDQLVSYLILDKLAKPGCLDLANNLLPQALSIISEPENERILIQGLVASVKEQACYEISDLFFLDINGNSVRRKDMLLKTVVLNVKGSSSNNSDRLFQSAVKEFAGNPNVVLAEIGYGKNFKEWQKEVRRAVPSNSAFIHLYSPQTGDQLDFMATIYDTLKTPTMVFYQYKEYGGHRNVLMSIGFRQSLKRNGNDTLSAVLETIGNEASKFDGPYVRKLADTTFTYRIVKSAPRIDTLLKQQLSEIEVPVDNKGNFFHVQLSEASSVRPSRYPMPEKALILSDIEGNLDAFRDLLINNHVMDSSYNWTFGEGHLIVTGDVFDRGRQVTGCLWLIYMLEQKAWKAGGDVHFILGNHEIMNLTGNFKYVYADYKRFAGMFGLNYADLHDRNSVLGKWLRSKNIIEIIGELLIVHGGISPEINSLKLSVEEINDRHRLFIIGQPAVPGDTAMQIILNGSASPYWYRGYYQTNIKKKVVESVIDSTLSLYNVTKIITGHTITEDISAFYGGKVINTDTHHASGDSEALLIEGENYYRVDLEGIRHKL